MIESFDHPGASRADVLRAGRAALAVLVAWACVAVVAAASGVVARLPVLLFPALIWSPVLGFVLAYWRLPALRAWVLAVDPRVPVLYHVVRVGFGAGFLVLLARHRLPASFAWPAGVGDVIAGLGALVAARCLPAHTRARRATVLAWNVVALADMVAVIVSVQGVRNDPQMRAGFAAFPYSTLPVFVVSLVLITHFVVFAQLRRGAPR